MLKKGSRVQVIPEMRSRFWDIGAKVGTVMEVGGWPVVEWPGIMERIRIDPVYLEVINADASAT